MKQKWFELLRPLASLALFTFILLTIYIFTLRLFGFRNIFYIGLSSLILSSIFILLLFFFLLPKNGFQLGFISIKISDLFPSMIAAFCLVYAFHVTGPTTLDRSISSYLLSRIEQPNGNTLAELKNNFLLGYFHNSSAICRRLEEQIKSRNIVFENGHYKLTHQGEMVLKMMAQVAKLSGIPLYYVKNMGAENSPDRFEANSCQRHYSNL